MSTEDPSLKSPPKALIYCEEGRRLLDAFGTKVQALVILHEHQFLAVTTGDLDCDRFDLLIHLANEEKQQAKYAYLKHLEIHGCSTNEDISKV